MPVIVETARPASGCDLSRRGVTVGVVNNMPDAAFEATERQFISLIAAAAPEAVVHLRLYSIPEVRRPDPMRDEIAARYGALSDLWDARLDGLIVTGTEPRAPKLEDEPYWPALTRLADWTRENTVSTIWSCLAAHAAVLHADGIERQPFADKLCGVFDFEACAAHPLVGDAGRLRVPHSRYNDLPEAALLSCGYRVLSRSAAAGVDAFVKQEPGAALVVFLQGHPEYADDSLLREYRRDVGRFLRGERPTYPAVPQSYFDERAMALLNAFRGRAIEAPRPALLRDFPMDRIVGTLRNTWRHSAVGIYRNWIAYLRERRVEARRRGGQGAVGGPESLTSPRRILKQPRKGG